MYRASIGYAPALVLVAALAACGERTTGPTDVEPDAPLGRTVSPAAVSTEGLVAWYPFDGDAADASGNGHDGALHNGVSFADGPRGASASFAGGDYVLVSDHDQLDTDAAMTLTAWVKPTAFPSNSAIFLSKWFSAGVVGDYLLRVMTGGRILGNVANHTEYGPAAGGLYLYSTVPPSVPLNEWSHVAMTFDAGVTRIYLDGVQVAQATTAFPSLEPTEYSTDDIFIGDFRGVNSPQYRFTGGIDEVRIYDRPLSPDEIVSLYTDPQDKDECKDGGWADFGFANQGQCVRQLETGKDSR